MAASTAIDNAPPSQNAYRQPWVRAMRGTLSPASTLAAGRKDCLMPKPKPCRPIGTKFTMRRLVAGEAIAIPLPPMIIHVSSRVASGQCDESQLTRHLDSEARRSASSGVRSGSSPCSPG